jgi:glutamyl-Q tRNA(Asp) synthetase|tara:strand:+ start:1532 stop:2380 length:849 start_codon:yes stop_codon:yes gene_type:complete
VSAILRFAPSPTGRLHLGHAYSALFTWRQAEAVGGRVLLRIEDIDRGRCRPEFEAGIFADLAWLGLEWETPVRRQSEHLDDYARALQRLEGRGLLYPCFCTRADIRREIAASPSAPHGTDGPVYPGTCRKLSADERAARRAIEAHALRLDVAASLDRVDAEVLTWEDAEAGRQVADPASHGDVVLARKDMPTSYHLAVSVDDALQGVTLVTRGQDLFAATHVHRLLQALLGLPVPAHHHHRLITDNEGRRLASRDRATELAELRQDGWTAGDVRRELGFETD